MSEQDDFSKYKMPGVAVDIVLFTIKDNDLQAGLVQREEDPYQGKFALPGRFVRYEEPIEETARMALKLKGGINPDLVFLEQLYTFGQNLKRDTRVRTISIVYYGLINSEEIDFQSGSKFIWKSVYKLPPLAFDHKEVIESAVKRLRKKVLESDFAFQLMPEEFTLSELQKAYQTILDKELDKRNFRKKIMELHILKDLKKQKMEGAHRPAQLYSFLRKKK